MKMQAIRQHEAGGNLLLESIEVPVPGPGEVLVKMHAAPVNPSDLAVLRGHYMPRSYPFTPGLEGSGKVVGAGSGLLPRLRLGKRVACSPNPQKDGTWAEYMVTAALRTITLPSGLSYEQGSMMVVNPMTALALFMMAREGKHRAIVNNAAASALGKMLINLSVQYGVPLINIVRKEARIDELKKMGAVHVLNSEDRNFASDLQRLAHDLQASLILDAVSGEQSSLLLKSAPEGATLVSYASLSGDSIRIDPQLLMMGKKRIVGFQLGVWLQTKGIIYKLRFVNKVKRHMSTTLASGICRIFPMEDMETAISSYMENMSAGKFIVSLDQSNKS